MWYGKYRCRPGFRSRARCAGRAWTPGTVSVRDRTVEISAPRPARCPAHMPPGLQVGWAGHHRSGVHMAGDLRIECGHRDCDEGRGGARRAPNLCTRASSLLTLSSVARLALLRWARSQPAACPASSSSWVACRSACATNLLTVPRRQDGVALAMLMPGLAATIALAGASRGALLDHAYCSHPGVTTASQCEPRPDRRRARDRIRGNPIARQLDVGTIEASPKQWRAVDRRRDQCDCSGHAGRTTRLGEKRPPTGSARPGVAALGRHSRSRIVANCMFRGTESTSSRSSG